MVVRSGRATGRSDLAQVLRNPHHLRVLRLLRREGTLGFTDIQKALDLNPAQVDRSLRVLTSGLWVLPETERTRGKAPVRVRYRLGHRGRALSSGLEAFLARLEAQRAALGDATLREANDLLA